MTRPASVPGAALAALAALALAASPAALAAPSAPPRVKIVTTMGDIVVQLNAEKAPITVQNFLAYVKNGFYAGTIFHRVVPGFVIQGGGYTVHYKAKETRPPIPIESRNGLKNVRGSIAMARSRNPNSATSQFYINLVDNKDLNASASSWGYAVFGHVVSGMDVVDKIASVPTGQVKHFSHAPKKPVVIKKVILMKSQTGQPDAHKAESSDSGRR